MKKIDHHYGNELNGLKTPLNKLNEKDGHELEEKQMRCPFCRCIYLIIQSIKRVVKEQERKDKEYDENEKQVFHNFNLTSSFSIPIGFKYTRPVLKDEKDGICKLH